MPSSLDKIWLCRVQGKKVKNPFYNYWQTRMLDLWGFSQSRFCSIFVFRMIKFNKPRNCGILSFVKFDF